MRQEDGWPFWAHRCRGSAFRSALQAGIASWDRSRYEVWVAPFSPAMVWPWANLLPRQPRATQILSRFGPATADRGSRGIRDQPRNPPKYTETRRVLTELHRDSSYPMMGKEAWVAGADRGEAPGPKPGHLGRRLRLRHQPPGSWQFLNGGVQRGVSKREAESTSPFRVLPCFRWLPVCNDLSCRGNTTRHVAKTGNRP